MECRPVFSAKALDPWCDTHGRSVICCIRDINLQVDGLRKVAVGLLNHAYEGGCPDEHNPEARAEHCPVCKILGPSEKRTCPWEALKGGEKCTLPEGHAGLHSFHH